VRAAVEQLRSGSIAGCNLLVATSASACVIEFGEELRVTPLPPGLRLLTNGALDDERDGRIVRVRHELRPTLATPDWIAEAKRICALGPEGDLPPIRLEGIGHGTVSSTIIALAEEPARSEYWFAEGLPGHVPYDDRSESLRKLLGGSAARATNHQILLRG